MNITKENGITMLMLVITVVVMLIIAATLTYYTVGDGSLMRNANEAKFKEEMSDLKSKVEQKIISKQEIAGTEDVDLTTSEQKEILGDYYPNKLIVKNQKMYYKSSGGFSSSEKKILEELNIELEN